MTTLTNRLYAEAQAAYPGGELADVVPLIREAADRIDALETALRELEHPACIVCGRDPDGLIRAAQERRRLAREALGDLDA